MLTVTQLTAMGMDMVTLIRPTVLFAMGGTDTHLRRSDPRLPIADRP